MPSNPCVGVEKYARVKRVRFFTDSENARMLDALDKLEASAVIQSAHADALRLLMITGARKMEILALKWSEVHVELGLILLPQSKSKNGDIRTIYLPKPAIEILDGRPRESDFVFPNASSKSGHIIDPKRAWKLVLAEAKIPPARIHDLRHNFASTAVGMNISLRLTGTLLGHRNAQSTEIYANVARDPAHEAIELVAAKLMRSRRETGATP